MVVLLPNNNKIGIIALVLIRWFGGDGTYYSRECGFALFQCYYEIVHFLLLVCSMCLLFHNFRGNADCERENPLAIDTERRKRENDDDHVMLWFVRLLVC